MYFNKTRCNWKFAKNTPMAVLINELQKNGARRKNFLHHFMVTHISRTLTKIQQGEKKNDLKILSFVRTSFNIREFRVNKNAAWKYYMTVSTFNQNFPRIYADGTCWCCLYLYISYTIYSSGMNLFIVLHSIALFWNAELCVWTKYISSEYKYSGASQQQSSSYCPYLLYYVSTVGTVMYLLFKQIRFVAIKFIEKITIVGFHAVLDYVEIEIIYTDDKPSM